MIQQPPSPTTFHSLGEICLINVYDKRFQYTSSSGCDVAVFLFIWTRFKNEQVDDNFFHIDIKVYIVLPLSVIKPQSFFAYFNDKT